jgi:hypothetical protein
MATKQKIMSGATGRAEGFAFEKSLKQNFNDAGFPNMYISEAKQNVEGSIAPRATNKNDLLLNVDDHSFGLSAKNPKTSSTTIQMQIIYKEKLLAQLGKVREVPQDTVEFFNLFFGGNILEDCSRLGISYEQLGYQHEQRRNRLLWDSIPERYRTSFLEYFNEPAIKRETLETVLKRGVTAQKGSDFMVWCDSSVAGKGNVENVVAFKIDHLINKILSKFDWEPSFHNNICSALYLGPVALQMKGSGSGKSYHSPQFRMSLNAARKKCRVPMLKGTCLQVLPLLSILGASDDA